MHRRVLKSFQQLVLQVYSFSAEKNIKNFSPKETRQPFFPVISALECCRQVLASTQLFQLWVLQVLASAQSFQLLVLQVLARVILAFGILGTREYSIISAFGTPGTVIQNDY